MSFFDSRHRARVVLRPVCTVNCISCRCCLTCSASCFWGLRQLFFIARLLKRVRGASWKRNLHFEVETTPLELFVITQDNTNDVLSRWRDCIKKQPTCFLVPVLFVHLGPVEVPTGQNSSVPLVSDPQAGLQPQVCLHPGSRSLALFALFTDKLEQTLPTYITPPPSTGIRPAHWRSHQWSEKISKWTPLTPLPANVPASRRTHWQSASQRCLIPKHVSFRGPSLVTPAAFAFATADWPTGLYQGTGRIDGLFINSFLIWQMIRVINVSIETLMNKTWFRDQVAAKKTS